MVQKIQTQRNTSSFSGSVQHSSSKITSQSSGLIFLFIFCSCTFLEKEYKTFKVLDSSKKTKTSLSPEETQQIGKYLSEGKHLFKKQKYKEAYKLFEKEESLQAHTQSNAKIHLGLILYKLKKYDQALEKLKQISSEYPPEWQLKSLHLQWKILDLQKSKNNFEKLYILSQIILHSPSLKKKQQARDLALLIIQNLSTNDIQYLQSDDHFSSINDLLLFKTAQKLVKEKKFKKALSQFKKLLSYTTYNAQMEEIAQQYIQALTTRTKVNEKIIGAILPLTGLHKRIGTRCLNGLQLGLGLYDTNPSDFKLVVIDSKGNSHFNRESVKEIILKHQAIGLVGGVVSQVAYSLAQVAQNFMIPLILLSQKSNLTSTKSFIFQNAVTHEHIIQSLVDTLMDHHQHTKFAILYPNDPFGVEYTNLFWDYVLSKGGQITGVQTYKPGETDFNDPIKRLTGTYYFEDRDKEYRKRLKKWFVKKRSKRSNKKLKTLLPPVVDFSVLFIPDSIKSLHHISPYMSFQNITGVTLAGTSLWNSSRLLKQKKETIEGIVFADAFITKHPKFKESSFFQNFQNIFGYNPGLFEFLSYQSALALRQVILSGKTSREDLREGLSQLNHLASPIGKVKISKKREFIYPITNFSVKDGQTIHLNP